MAPHADPSERPAWTDRVDESHLPGLLAPTVHETTALEVEFPREPSDARPCDP